MQAAFLRCLGEIRLFFNPSQGSYMADAESARQAPGRTAFLGCPNHRFLKFFARALGLKNASETTGFAFVFGIANAIMAIFYDLIGATAMTAFFLGNYQYSSLLQI